MNFLYFCSESLTTEKFECQFLSTSQIEVIEPKYNQKHSLLQDVKKNVEVAARFHRTNKML